MIRTAAALFAKKTAVVAITGAVVLGGATLALAEIGQQPVDGACGTDEVLNDQTGLCEADPNVAPEEEPCTDELETPDIDECAPEEQPCTDELETPDIDECAPEEQPCTDDLETPDIDECAPEEQPCTDDLETPDIDECAPEEEAGDDDIGTDELDEDLVAEHPENHGKYVSEAAKGGGDCAGLTGREKGHCVATVAKSDAGKGDGTEEEPVTPDTTDVSTETDTGDDDADDDTADDDSADDDSADDDAEAPELDDAEAPAETTGKPAHAGDSGGGKGPKK